MTNKTPFRIANISNNPDPDWVWLRDLMPRDLTVNGRPLEWTGYSMAAKSPRLAALGRLKGAHALTRDARKQPFDLVVSHGPWATAWTEWVAGPAINAAKHLAFSFNYTDLPTGVRKRLMQSAFKNVDGFAVFTDAEQGLYADFFNIDQSRFLRAPWGVSSPLTKIEPRAVSEAYFAALGGEARDYEVLCEAARALPDIQFIVVARPHNFDGLNPPPNLEVRFNLPFNEAWAIVQHAEAAIIPLRSRETPCGLVTLVGAMHLGKAQIVTDAAGAADYIKDRETGLLVPARDSAALVEAIKTLADDPELAMRIGHNAKNYAAQNCSEDNTIQFFTDLLKNWFGKH
ncbi:glycosyltransferase family 4 protein [Hyphococcus formosus]|uniref:glycosyltransferase family 4 protein n=1 Tax=Hyphococcus formosus TaxID=3143534 RepID=UPI00398BAA64